MTEAAVLNLICVECLEVLNSDTHQRDFQNNPICNLCAKTFYTPCAECERVIAKDEVMTFNAGSNTIIYKCFKCKSSITNQADLNYIVDEVAELVDRYVSLHTEEKQIKEKMEEIKEQLKTIAKAQSDGGKKAVALAGTGGKPCVKCTYRTSFRADAVKVAELKDCLGNELFATLFSEKFSFDVNKSNFEKIISGDAELPKDVRQQIEDAVKISVSATLNVA